MFLNNLVIAESFQDISLLDPISPVFLESLDKQGYDPHPTLFIVFPSD